MKDVVNNLGKLPNDVTIISCDNEEVHTSKFILAMFSQSLHHLLSTSTSSSDSITLILPDILASSIKTLINIITNGETNPVGLTQKNLEVLETARIFNIELNIELFHNEFKTEINHTYKTATESESSKNRSSLNVPSDVKLFDGVEMKEAKDSYDLSDVNTLAKDNNPSDTNSSVNEPKKSLRKNITQIDKTFSCDKCAFTTKLQGSLVNHRKSKHDGLQYVCDQCGYKNRHKAYLQSHINTIHKGIWLFCDKCDHKAVGKPRLKKHIEAKHEGIRYFCDRCAFSASFKRNLKRHIQAIHEGVRYPCSQCNSKFTQSQDLKRHIKLNHYEKAIVERS